MTETSKATKAQATAQRKFFEALETTDSKDDLIEIAQRMAILSILLLRGEAGDDFTEGFLTGALNDKTKMQAELITPQASAPNVTPNEIAPEIPDCYKGDPTLEDAWLSGYHANQSQSGSNE